MAFDAETNREIGLRLRGCREQHALTRERLAEYADISVQFLADIETGRKGMTVQTLRKLALALHCSTDELVTKALIPGIDIKSWAMGSIMKAMGLTIMLHRLEPSCLIVE